MTGSTGFTLNSSEDSNRIETIAASSPHIYADARQQRSVTYEHSRQLLLLRAQAMRIPISLVRCDTE